MTSNAIAAITALALAAGAQAVAQSPPASGAQQPGLTKPTVQPPSQQEQKDPSNKLVLTPPVVVHSVVNVTTRQVMAPPLLALPQWKVECGSKVAEVNPDIDPKSIISPSPASPEPKIRRISPPPCPGGSSMSEMVRGTLSGKVVTVKPSGR